MSDREVIEQARRLLDGWELQTNHPHWFRFATEYVAREFPPGRKFPVLDQARQVCERNGWSTLEEACRGAGLRNVAGP